MFSEPYYAPVPQVDRGHSGHLGAGVPLQVQEVPRTVSNLKEKDSALYTSLLLSTIATVFEIFTFFKRDCTFYLLQFPCLVSNLYCTKYLYNVELGQDHEDLQGYEEDPEGGQRDSVNCNYTCVN